MFKKNLYYGFLHVLVSLTSILFVIGVTGVNLTMTFLAVGIGTIIFHFVTKNKLAVLMGVSGSYIAGITYVAQKYGPQYIGGAVIVAGAIYIVMGLLYIKFRPQIPRYILSMAVIFIALSLLPIGANLAKGNVMVAAATMIITFICRDKIYAMPAGLIGGTATYYLMGGTLKLAKPAVNFAVQVPKFNLDGILMISLVAFAAAFEALGDMTNCAHAQEIEIENKDYALGLIGNGLSSMVAGLFGAPPLTTYSENIGFIYLSKWKDATAQIVTGVIYIIMAFIPQTVTLFSIIPTPVFGALLLYLFALIMVGNLQHLDGFKPDVVLVMLIGFYIAPVGISPIAVAMIMGVIVESFNGRIKKA